MTRPKKRTAAMILAVLVLICSFADVLTGINLQIFAAGEHNYIANNCDAALGTVSVQTGGEEYVEIHMLNDATPYGRSVAIYPNAENADRYYSIVYFDFKSDWKLSKTNGIAFYTSIPQVSLSTLNVALRLSGSDCFNADASGSAVGYQKNKQASAEWITLSSESGVLSGKSGYEGFVFIPYSAFEKAGTALTAKNVADATSVELMVSVASKQKSDYQKDFVFDEFGFYEDTSSYIRSVNVSYGTEYVANSGENAKDTVKLAWNCTEGQITYSQLSDPLAKYGDAIALTTGNLNSGWNNYKTGIVVQPESSWDISATNGYAFYCELPDADGADTAMDIWWYIDDDIYWNELKPGKPIYYVADGSDKIETTIFSWDDYSLPGHNHGGFKGFIFVPFDSFNQRFKGNDRKYINEADYFEMRVGIARRPDQEPALAEQTFVFDEAGLYTDPLSYIEAVKAKSCYSEYEIIACDGTDALNSVKLPAGYNGVTVSQQGLGVSPYGEAIGITTAASGWNSGKAGIVLDAKDKNLSMSNGIAFYAKVPDVSALDTALDVWLWNTDRYCWNELVPGSDVYYIDKGSSTASAVKFQWGDYTLPLHNKSGWEGFVFIPFESFKCTWSDNEGKDLDLIRERKKFELRFNVAKTDAGLANQTFVFDELGFYRDPVSYVSAAQKDLKAPKQTNYVGNSCANISETVVLPGAIGGGKVVLSQQDGGITPYGAALKMTLGTSGWNADKIRVKMDIDSECDVAAAKGFAFYVKAPAVDSSVDPCLDVMLYYNDTYFWNSLEVGKQIYYLEKGSDTVTSEIFSWDNYTLPIHNRSGYEGFVFIPFDSLKMKYSGTDRDIINAAKSLQVWLNPASTNSALAGQTYILDEFGFYSDEVTYRDNCLKKDGAEVKGMEYLSNSANDASKAHICGTTDKLKLTQVADAANMGQAYVIYPEKAGANEVWTQFDLPRENDWDLTRTQGIAFYAKLPEYSGTGLQVMLYLDDSHYYNDPVKSNTFYYMAKGTDTVEKHKIGTSDYPFTGKSGYDGWFFLPYNAMQKNGDTLTAAVAQAAENVSVRISLISADTDDYNKNYVIDELGFYSDPMSYAKYVKSFYVDTSANYIANDGSNAADTVCAQWDMTNQITVAQSKLGVSPYGASISMTNASSGWNMYKTAYVMDVDPEWNISETNGVAFYVQIPDSDIDPALDFLFLIDNDNYWYGNLSDAMIYYLADGSDTLTEDYATNLICHNMQGFSGFVFVPYDSFKGMSGKRGIINKATRFEWRVNSAQSDRALLGKTYVFDELGFYSDPIAYAEKAKELHGSYEYIVNDASDANTFGVTAGGESLLNVVQTSKGQAFGNAVKVSPSQSGYETAGANISLKREPIYNVSMTNGIAFFVSVPSGINANGVSIALKAGEKTYTGTASGEKIYYIEKNCTDILSDNSENGILKGKAGFTGFVFVPFEAISGIDRDVIDNASGWNVILGINTDSKIMGKSYIFDEIGFYRDPASYAQPVKDINANYIAQSFDDLSAMTESGNGTQLRLVSGKTPYGSALSIVPTKVRADNSWDRISIKKDASWNLDKTEGIAMYVRMPGGISETQVTVMLYINDSLFYPNNTGPVYYIPKNSDGSVVRVSSRQTLYDKVAFEGFVFIPYSSLTAHDGGKIDVNALQKLSNFQIRISHYRLNEDELNKDFIFDEVGFYSDQDMYMEAVRQKYGITSKESDGNYVANHGDDTSLTTVKRDGNSFTAVELDNRNSPYGSSYLTADISQVNEWHSVNLGCVLDTENNSAAKKAKGIAFYARFPDAVEDTYCGVSLFADEYNSFELKSGHYEDETPYKADYVLIGLDGKRREVHADYALEQLQGFEGYVFIPYTSFHNSADETKTALDSLDYIANSRCELRFYREFDSRDVYNRRFVVDEIGFYKDEAGYIELLKAYEDTSGRADDGNAIINSCASVDEFCSEDDAALAVKIVGEKTSTGMSAEVVSRYADDSSTEALLKLDVSTLSAKNSKGVAFYIDAPKAAEVTFILKVNDTLSYKGTKQVSAGTKGLVFIPFESFSSDVEAMIASLDMSYSLDGGLVQTVSADAVGSAFIYDSIGFYSDESGYQKLVDSSFDATNDSIGNYPYTLDKINYTVPDTAKYSVNNESSTAIEVLDVTPKNASEQRITFKIDRKKNELWQLSNGIAFFVDLASGKATVTSIMFEAGKSKSRYMSGLMNIVPLADEYSKPSEAHSLSSLDGKKGFVFIPFESLSPAITATNLSSVESVTVTVGIMGSGKTASIGAMGFYGGVRPYIRSVRNMLGYGNYILNDGEKLSTWNCLDGGQYATSVIGKSPSGKAVALVPDTAGTDHFTEITLNTDVEGIEKTLGLAFYFNMPPDRSSTDMGIRLQISDTEHWDYSAYSPVCYAANNNSDIKVEKKTSVMSGMEGTKSYAFIPFSSMKRTYVNQSGNTVTEALSNDASKLLNGLKSVKLRINNRRSSKHDTNYEYVFDTVGFYSDVNAYLETAGQTATVSYVTDAGYAPNKSTSFATMLHTVNMLDSASDLTVTGGTAVPATVDGERAVALRTSKAFTATFDNDLFGSEEAKSVTGIMMYIQTPKGVADPAMTVTLTDKNGEKYNFNSGNYYYYCKDEGERIVRMNGKLSLPEFAGNVMIPFASFTDSNKLSFADIKTVTVSGGEEFAGKETVLQKVSAYPDIDFLRMSIADFGERFTVTASSENGITVSNGVIRLHETSFTYKQLLSKLAVDPSVFSLALPSGIDPDAVAKGSFKLNVLKGKVIVASLDVEVVDQDTVPDTLVIITPEVPEVPDRDVVIYEKILVEDEEFEEEPKPEFVLFKVKEAAASLVKLEGDTVTLTSVMSAKRLISAFAVADGVKLCIADADSCLVKDKDAVYDGYYLIVEYDGVKTGYKIKGLKPSAAETEDNNILLWVIIAGAAVLLIAAVTVLLIVLKKKKSKKA